MEMPDHAWMSTLPSGAQIAINIATFLVALCGGLWAYLSQMRKAKPSVTPAPDGIALPMIQIADMAPVRELVAQVRRLADAQEAVHREHKALREMIGEWIDEEEIERRVRQRLAQKGNATQ